MSIGGASEGFGALMGRVSHWGGRIAAVSVVAMMGLICVEVFGRALFGFSTMVADEMSGYLNCAVVFLGLSYSLRERGFIRVEVIYNRLRGAAKRTAQWGICLVSLVYTAIVVIYMARHVRYSFERGVVSTQVSEIPLYLPQSVILVGSSILALQLAAYLLNRLRGLP